MKHFILSLFCLCSSIVYAGRENGIFTNIYGESSFTTFKLNQQTISTLQNQFKLRIEKPLFLSKLNFNLGALWSDTNQKYSENAVFESIVFKLYKPLEFYFESRQGRNSDYVSFIDNRTGLLWQTYQPIGNHFDFETYFNGLWSSRINSVAHDLFIRGFVKINLLKSVTFGPYVDFQSHQQYKDLTQTQSDIGVRSVAYTDFGSDGFSDLGLTLMIYRNLQTRTNTNALMTLSGHF